MRNSTLRLECSIATSRSVHCSDLRRFLISRSTRSPVLDKRIRTCRPSPVSGASMRLPCHTACNCRYGLHLKSLACAPLCLHELHLLFLQQSCRQPRRSQLHPLTGHFLHTPSLVGNELAWSPAELHRAGAQQFCHVLNQILPWTSRCGVPFHSLCQGAVFLVSSFLAPIASVAERAIYCVSLVARLQRVLLSFLSVFPLVRVAFLTFL